MDHNLGSVDVSWLHHSKSREHHHRAHAPSSPGLAKDALPKTSSNGGLPVQPPSTPSDKNNAVVTDAIAPHEQTPQSPQPPTSTPLKSFAKRPSLSGRAASEKSTSSTSSQGSDSSKGSARRGSWISSLSSKFEKLGGPQSPTSGAPNSPKSVTNGAQHAGPGTQANGHPQNLHSVKEGAALKSKPAEEVDPYVPQAPKSSGSSFFSNAFRRLSSSSATSSSGKVVGNGGICARRVMNVDHNRERCTLPELDQNKLRKVSFCVDVEIAGGPRYKDEPDTEEKKKKNKDNKMKEKGEGAALKNPQAAAEQKDKDESVAKEDLSKPSTPDGPTDEKDDTDGIGKKQRTEEEKKERAERKRRKAEENGTMPREFSRDVSSSPNPSHPATPRPQDRPTVDPLRIYRRCCQLRETPILKRITEQLAQPTICPVDTPGTVTCLNLTGSRLQLPDVVALSDWLAIVPVKKLLLEDADLTDEGVRVVLAGLLAAKPPQEQRSSTRQTQAQLPGTHQFPTDHSELHHERLGIVEKLTLKNNPRLTAEAWKHVSLFVYMCRSLKALDVSMNAFPQSPQSDSHLSAEPLSRTGSNTTDVGEIFAKALSTRLGGNHLEELMMAECELASSTVRKIVDAVEMSGVSRLGLAGNNLDDESLEAVVHYLRSGVCQGLDLASNNMDGRLAKLVEGLSDESPLWALSLADNSLKPESLKPLFPVLLKLPNLRFIDLSRNHALFESKPDALPILRKYIPLFQHLKRFHLMDVALEPRQAIGLAEVLPESPNLAHLNIMDNPELQRLASATTEADQEEACALYASLMAAARVSDSIVCIDIDVPTPENSEIVKALGKQTLAYCLRNMERFAAAELPDVADATSSATESHNVTAAEKDIEVPEVLLHLVGHVEGSHENHDEDGPAPDDDYIVGGTGIIKALQYCLSEKAAEMKKESAPNSGAATPQRKSIDVKGGASVKAKKLSKNLLESARKIRMRLRPALLSESKSGDDMAYRRLLFLDDTLKQIIDRFEAEYPETRLNPPPDATGGSPASTPSSTPSRSMSSSHLPTDPNTPASKDTDSVTNSTTIDDSDDEDMQGLGRRSRHASDVSLAGRMMGIEEGRMHKIGQAIRKDLFRDSKSEDDSAVDDSTSEGPTSDVPETAELSELKQKIENKQGAELREEVKNLGWEEVLKKIGSNVEEMKKLRKAGEMGDLGEDEEAEWARFREAQEKSIQNARNTSKGAERKEKTDSAIVE